jgi:HSP20 family molecular chaperone IbpA
MEIDSTSRISQANSAAAKAEREAAERVTQAQKHVREANHEEEVQLEHLRDSYEHRTESEQARGENYLEAVRNRSYQSVSELRKQTDHDTHRLTTDAEKNLKDLDHHYQDATYAETRRGESTLKETTERNYKALEHERATGNEKIAAVKSSNEQQKAQYEADRRDTATTLAKQTQTNRQELQEKSRVAVEESGEHYQAAYDGAIKQSKDALADLNWRASRETEKLRRDTMQKLDGYASQKTDPFYRLVDVEGKITEHPDQFVFTAKIPPQERDRININVRANELIISGKRKSEESLEVDGGQTIRTNSYQSYSENFPLGFPVEPKNMTREYDGDTLIVRIPKKMTYAPAPPKKVAERAVLERPKFPKNLPTESDLVAINDPGRGPEAQTDDTPPSKRTGRTLA